MHDGLLPATHNPQAHASCKAQHDGRNSTLSPCFTEPAQPNENLCTLHCRSSSLGTKAYRIKRLTSSQEAGCDAAAVLLAKVERDRCRSRSQALRQSNEDETSCPSRRISRRH